MHHSDTLGLPYRRYSQTWEDLLDPPVLSCTPFAETSIEYLFVGILKKLLDKFINFFLRKQLQMISATLPLCFRPASPSPFLRR